jgi:hypothetical protein
LSRDGSEFRRRDCVALGCADLVLLLHDLCGFYCAWIVRA